MTPEAVAALLKELGSDSVQGDAENSPELNDSRDKRTEILTSVLTACTNAWPKNPGELEKIAEKLGDGSRDVAWRLPYGDSGIVDFFLEVLGHGDLPQRLHVHCLRLIGNSCADTDENRARVVQDNRLENITRHFSNEELLPFNVPVVYNILVDYEPAQLLASQSGLSQQLVALLKLTDIGEYTAFVPYICKTLALLVSQEGEPSRADQDTVSTLLSLAILEQEDVDDFITLAGVAAAYLADESFQRSMIERKQVKQLLDVFYQAYVGFDTASIDDEAIAQLKQLRITLLTCVADISGNDNFAPIYPLSGDVAQVFLGWLQSGSLSLQSAACLALGNLSRSDEASLTLVQTLKAHTPLIKALQDATVTDSQFLHASLSFLKNLAIPTQNKPLLADLLDAQGLPRIYSLDAMPQIQFAAISLTRLLLVSCSSNARMVCLPSGLTSTSSTDRGHSKLQEIISLFDRSDAEPTKLEAARCVATICRMLHSADVAKVLSSGPGESLKDLAIAEQGNSQPEVKRTEFYATNRVGGPLRYLITQEKWPSLRSEAWFVFALMSRSVDGARVILEVLEAKAAEDILAEAITGNKPVAIERDSENLQVDGVSESGEEMTSVPSSLQLEPQQVDPRQKESMGRVDRENVLILCTELVKGDTLDPTRKSWLQSLIKEGTRKLVVDKTG